VAQVSHVTGGVHLERHLRRDDKKLAGAITLPFAAGQLGLERAGDDAHVFFAIGAETVLARLDHAEGCGTLGSGDGQALDFAFKIRIVFHAGLMPVFSAVDNHESGEPREKPHRGDAVQRGSR